MPLRCRCSVQVILTLDSPLVKVIPQTVTLERPRRQVTASFLTPPRLGFEALFFGIYRKNSPRLGPRIILSFFSLFCRDTPDSIPRSVCRCPPRPPPGLHLSSFSLDPVPCSVCFEVSRVMIPPSFFRSRWMDRHHPFLLHPKRAAFRRPDMIAARLHAYQVARSTSPVSRKSSLIEFAAVRPSNPEAFFPLAASILFGLCAIRVSLNAPRSRFHPGPFYLFAARLKNFSRRRALSG